MWSSWPPALFANHPTDGDLSAGTPVKHPTDGDLSVGTPVVRNGWGSRTCDNNKLSKHSLSSRYSESLISTQVTRSPRDSLQLRPALPKSKTGQPF